MCVLAPPMDCGGGELSDSGSSGYWSVGRSNGSPAPSPTIAEPAISPATPPDEGLDMELEQVLFDEPAPRKRRVSRSDDSFTPLNETELDLSPTSRPSVDGVFPPAELGEGGLQVSVAELWEGADVSGGNKTSHPDNTPVVRLT